MPSNDEQISSSNRKLATSWLILVIALALHVADEAFGDFLSFYNPFVADLKSRFGFFPMPVFSFEVWLGGLILIVIILFAITPILKQGGKFLRMFAMIFAILMIVNALGHMIGSAYFGFIVPGFWSSPFLLLAASLSLYSTIVRARI